MKLSIITVCYNNIDGLKLTADSVANQTMQDFEWVIVDGGSNDGTQDYVRTLTRKPDMWISEPDKGVYDAMNKGTSMATGEYLLFLNSGDYLHASGSLELLLQQPIDADVVYGDLVFVNNGKSGVGHYPHDVGLLFLLYSSIGHPSALIKAQALREVGGYDDRLRIVSDWKLWLELYLRGKTFKYQPVVFSDFVVGGISSTQIDRSENERRQILSEIFASEEYKALMPKVSIAIPYEKESNEARETEDAINRQFYPNQEIIQYADSVLKPSDARYFLTVTKDDLHSPEYVAREIERLERSHRERQCAIVIPIYKEELTTDETRSFLQGVNVLSAYDIILLCPEGLDLRLYDDLAGKHLREERFPRCYFEGIDGYNKLMLSNKFYSRFTEYEYILIYQLDAWVFSDELTEWCNKGYDYIGAPWFELCKKHEDGYKLWRCGNGGLSLRRVQKFIDFTSATKAYTRRQMFLHKYHGIKTLFRSIAYAFSSKNNCMRNFIQEQLSIGWNEDWIISILSEKTRLKMNLPSALESAHFAIEVSPEYIYNNVLNKHLPFGCHAWHKWQYDDFWKQFIG